MQDVCEDDSRRLVPAELGEERDVADSNDGCAACDAGDRLRREEDAVVEEPGPVLAEVVVCCAVDPDTIA